MKKLVGFVIPFLFISTLAFGVDKVINAPSGDLKLTGSGDIYTDRNVGIGKNNPTALLELLGTPQTSGELDYSLAITDDAAVAAGVGGGILFLSRFTDTPNYTGLGGIQAIRENATPSNSAGALALYSRPNGGDITERMRITSGGVVKIGEGVGSWYMQFAATPGDSVRHGIYGTTDLNFWANSGNGFVFTVDNSSKGFEIGTDGIADFKQGISFPNGGSVTLNHYSSGTNSSCSTSGVNFDFDWVRIGTIVNMRVNFSGTISGSPSVLACAISDSSLVPANGNSQSFPVWVNVNGTLELMNYTILYNGPSQLRMDLRRGSGAPFSNVPTQSGGWNGVNDVVVTYRMN